MEEVHCKEKPIYVFLFWELRGLSPNFLIDVSVSDLFIPRIGPHTVFPCSKIGRPIPWKYIYLSQIYECMNWETEHYKSVLEITVSFLGIHRWEQTLIVDTHPPFICSVNTVQYIGCSRSHHKMYRFYKNRTIEKLEGRYRGERIIVYV